MDLYNIEDILEKDPGPGTYYNPETFTCFR